MRRPLTFPVLAAVAALAAAPLAGAILSAPRATAASAAVGKDPVREVAVSQAKLTWKLLEQGPRGDDMLVSPASLASAFWALDLGADRVMDAALLKALELSDHELLDKAHETFAASDPAILATADQLVFPPQFKPSRLVLAGLDHLGVGHRIADITKADDVKDIDAWIAKQTHDEIPQILGKPQPRPAFVALNALYFKAKWKEAFAPQATVSSPFQPVDGAAEPTMLMRLGEAERAYRTDKTFIGVDLPFAGERYWLTVVTSSDGKAKTLKQFEPVASWLSGDGFETKKGDLALPRFSLEKNNELLAALDVALREGAKSPTALSEFGTGAKIDGILQRTKIEVDEQGATAAAATAVVVSRAMVVDDSVHMRVDKPFLFALRDRQSGLILAAGYVGKAPKGKV